MMRRPWWVLPLALLLAWLVSLTPTAQRASHALLDAQLQLVWPEASHDDVAVIDIDEASIRALQLQLGQWPYRRGTYATLAGYLFEQGARAVVLDLPLSEPNDGDEAFARALRRFPRLVLAAEALNGTQGGGDPEVLRLQGSVWPAHWPRTVWPAVAAPGADLLAMPVRLGVVAPFEGDGRLRRWPLLHEAQGRGLPALPLAALQAIEPDVPLRYADGRARLGSRSWPLDAQGRVVTTLPAGEPAIGFLRVAAAALGITNDPALRARIAGRIVFVGSSVAARERDTKPSTAAWAAATRALAAGRVLGPPSRALDAALPAIGALPLLTLRRRLRSDARTEALLALAAMLAVLLASTFALAAFGLQSQPLTALVIAAVAFVLVWALQPRGHAPLQAAGDEPARSGARS